MEDNVFDNIDQPHKKNIIIMEQVILQFDVVILNKFK